MTTIQPVTCQHCNSPLDLQIVDWDPTEPSIRQSYRCPECKQLHTVELPGQIVFVVRRIVPRIRVAH
jgi:hypothetical protein